MAERNMRECEVVKEVAGISLLHCHHVHPYRHLPPVFMAFPFSFHRLPSRRRHALRPALRRKGARCSLLRRAVRAQLCAQQAALMACCCAC